MPENNTINCHSKKIPLWLVLVDNIPTLLLFLIGFHIIYMISLAWAIIYLGYAFFSVVWFWARICPYCHHYGTFGCPCGYGTISARLFPKKDDRFFKKIFRKNIFIQFPNWFAPLGVAAYLLATRYSKMTLYLTIAFVFVGFIVIPLVSKLVGCRNCEIKEDCPWMSGRITLEGNE